MADYPGALEARFGPEGASAASDYTPKRYEYAGALETRFGPQDAQPATDYTIKRYEYAGALGIFPNVPWGSNPVGL